MRIKIKMKIESHKNGRLQHTRSCVKLNVNIVRGTHLKLSSQMLYALYTDFVMPQFDFFNNWTLKPVTLEGQYDAQTSKWPQMIYYSICFPPLILLCMARKAPGLKKYTVQQGSSPCQKLFQFKLEKYVWKYLTEICS